MADSPAEPASPAPAAPPVVHVVPEIILPPDPTSPEIRGYPREAVNLITSFGLEVRVLITVFKRLIVMENPVQVLHRLPGISCLV